MDRRPNFRVRLLSCAVAVALLGCASDSAKRTPRPFPQAQIATANSPAMGLVGLAITDPLTGHQRAAGMQGVMVGYVVSHPALPTDLRVPAGRDGHPLPVLAFKVTSVITQADGRQGPEELRGHGTLEVFFNPDGFSETVLHYPQALENSEQIESDEITFYEKTDFNTSRFYLHLQETVTATRAFSFAGRSWRTPVHRTADDLLIGEYSDAFFGDAYVSTNVASPLSPEEQLIALAGSPHRVVRY
jgi:hypothetical protein